MKRLIAGLVGGFLAGVLSLAFGLVLVGPDEIAGGLKILLVGSSFLGMFLGVIEYREIKTGAWIALLVAVRISLLFLGFLVAFAIKEALEVEATWGIIASPIGCFVGVWIGQLVNAKVLLPRARSQTDRGKRL